MNNFIKINIVIAVLLVALAGLTVRAAVELDPGFNPSTTIINGFNLISAEVKQSVTQPDGKVLICGSFTVVGTSARSNVARLNTDGTVDQTFNPPEIYAAISTVNNITTSATATAIGLQPDGKILLGGDFNYVNGVYLPHLIRLNADGSPDTAFNTAVHQDLTQFEGSFYDIRTQADGKILLAGDYGFLRFNTVRIFGGISRLNADGSYDTTFSETFNNNGWMKVQRTGILPDGRIMVGGTGSTSFNRGGLARLNPDGTLDFSFPAVQLNPNSTVYDLEVLGSGQTLIVGSFSTLNGFARKTIARINGDGSIDATFNGNNVGGNNSPIKVIEPIAGGQFLVGGEFSAYNGVGSDHVARINADGSLDPGFSNAGLINGAVTAVARFPNGNVLYAGDRGTWDYIGIANSAGVYQTGNYLVGTRGIVNAILRQPDGKILVGGRFQTANGVKRLNIARLNADGTLDAGFNTNNQTNVTISRMALQPDGKILIATAPGTLLIRLNADGSKDTGFQTVFASGNQQDVLVQPDGRIILAGDYNSSVKLARFQSNGAADTTFNPGTIDGLVERVVAQPDGKLIIAGWFTQVGGSTRGRIARLNADGSLDNTFNPPGGANDTIYDAAVQADGRIVVVGDFTGLNGVPSPKYVGRFNSDGTVDSGFNPQPNAPVYTVSLQTDGKVLIGGAMLTVGGVSRSGLARLNPDGTLDPGFQTGSGTNNLVWALTVQPDGKILVGGEFTKFNGVSKITLLRLQTSAAPARSPFDYDGDGKADVSVFRPSENKWYILRSSDFGVTQTVFAIPNDIPVPADYDGDGKTDVAIFRPANGAWWYLSSITGAQINVNFGQAGDIPRPSDFDGDGRTDFVVFRPSTSVWYRMTSTGVTSFIAFGAAGDKPVTGDFDGDGKSDPAVFRPSTGDWWYAASASGGQFLAAHWGQTGDVPAPADFDGDGKTDFAIFRPSDGGWFVSKSAGGGFISTSFGTLGDKPIPADYDGDGKADIAVFRPSTGVWYLSQTTAGFGAVQWGVATDTPTENAFIP
ncbi:MAG: VCBS repeat-containing protein [Acidobacteria bacterium]|nr:VCBS repeat-containing protein [Acidobacteriota bacterium]